MNSRRPSLLLALFLLGFSLMAGCGGSRGLPEEPSVTLLIPLDAQLPSLITPATVRAGTQTWSADWEAPWQHLHIQVKDVASGQSLSLYEKSITGNTLRLRGPFQGRVISLWASNVGAKRRARPGSLGVDYNGTPFTDVNAAITGEQTFSVLLGRVTGAVGSTLTGLPALSHQNVLASKLYWNGKSNTPAVQAYYIQFSVTDGASHPIRQTGDLLEKAIKDGDMSLPGNVLVEDSLLIGYDATLRLLFKKMTMEGGDLNTLETIVQNESEQPNPLSLTPLTCNSSAINGNGVECILTGSNFGTDSYNLAISLTAVNDPKNIITPPNITAATDSEVRFILSSYQSASGENELFRLKLTRTATSGTAMTATHSELITVTYDEGGN